MSTSSNFFTIGMPRCRSLWLSCLFSFGDSYCLHEYLSNYTEQTSMPEFDGIAHVGSCDTFPFGFDADLVGDSPLLIIHRPLDEIKRSLAVSFGFEQSHDPARIFDDMYDKLLSIKTSNCLPVDFDDFYDVANVKAVVEFMGLDIPDFHIQKLMTTKIVISTDDLAMSHHMLNLNREL